MVEAEQACLGGMETNTLHVVLPPGMGLRSATDALRRFGDVSHVEVLPGHRLTVSAVFFDVRSAARAEAALGAGCSKRANQTGCRLVRMPGKVQLDIDKIRGVSRVLPEPRDSSVYLVEFFDIRDAQRARELAMQMIKKPGAAVDYACVEAMAKDAPQASVPAYIKPSNAFSPPAALGSTREAVSHRESSGEATILLQGLPKALCNSSCLEAMFEQAGLEGAIASCRVRRGSASSEVLLTVNSRQAARRCIKHFNGRRWDVSGDPVTATLAKFGGDEPKPHQPTYAGTAGASRPQRSARAKEATSTKAAAPTGTARPKRDVLQAADPDKHEQECPRSPVTDESTADGASVASDQDEAMGEVEPANVTHAAGAACTVQAA